MTARASQFFAGLDLGPPGEPTGFAVVERPAPPAEPELRVRHLERFAPGTPYESIVDGAITRLPAHTPLVVDQTGVGGAVVRLLRSRRPMPRVVPAALTAGHAAHVAEDGCWLVPKVELVTALQLALQARLLKVAPELPDAEALARDLAAFRLRAVPLADAATAAWREGASDDLVFAVALACWWAGRCPRVTGIPISMGGGILRTAPAGVFRS